MPRAFLLWKEVKAKIPSPHTREQEITNQRNQNPNMKTLIITTVMLLTVAFAHPASARDRLVLFQGFYSAVDTVQPGPDGTLIVDGSGHGFSTLGKFDITFHFTVNLTTGKEEGTSHLTFRNGDTFDADLVGVGDIANVDAIQVVSEIHFQTSGTGRFASGIGDFTAEVMLDIAPANPTLFASFRGEFIERRLGD
jgi:hypothetical protein